MGMSIWAILLLYQVAVCPAVMCIKQVLKGCEIRIQFNKKKLYLLPWTNSHCPYNSIGFFKIILKKSSVMKNITNLELPQRPFLLVFIIIEIPEL